MSGIHSTSLAIWLSAATAGVNFLCTFLGLFMVDRIGRRKLTLGSLVGVVLSLLILAAGFHVSAIESPPVQIVESPAANTCLYT